jgi:RNA polymerase sigma-70 factor (ECF subfamily)
VPGPAALEDAWRRDGGRLLAALSRRFRDIDLAEECLAEAAARAQGSWTQTPANPSGWLYRTALRLGIDRLRQRARRRVEAIDDLDLEAGSEPTQTPDDRLGLYFLCAHPALGEDSRIALMLRLVAGLPVETIARAFLAEPAAILQRITRAKAKIAAARLPFDPPPRSEWPERMQGLLSALSIIYDQGYADVGGGIEAEAFAREAATLAESLAELTGDAEALGLAALIRFCESRRPARVARDGAMIPLDEQDVKLWRVSDIATGAEHLARAAEALTPGPWQIQALIHAAHARRLNEGATPWGDIADLYDALLRLDPSPIVAVNRALARSQIFGPAPALAELDAPAAQAALKGWQPYHAARADLLRRADRREEAYAEYDRAIALAPGRAERRFLEGRRAAIF